MLRNLGRRLAHYLNQPIKYLTQSTWSHAALFVGDFQGTGLGLQAPALIEADLEQGVLSVPLSHYEGHNPRVCRPASLSEADSKRACRYAIDRIGHGYDLKNIVDLARYLLPVPPVPVYWRRRTPALGSGSPTRAICSTLIAQALQSVRYPILPRIELSEASHLTQGGPGGPARSRRATSTSHRIFRC